MRVTKPKKIPRVRLGIGDNMGGEAAHLDILETNVGEVVAVVAKAIADATGETPTFTFRKPRTRKTKAEMAESGDKAGEGEE